MSAPLLVIGLGNPPRRDDGAGRQVARRLACRRLPGVEVVELVGQAAELLEIWRGRRRVVVVDAVCSGGAAGAIHERRAGVDPPFPTRSSLSTHGQGLVEAIALATALGELPPELFVLGIEAADLGWGEGLSEGVERAVDEVVERLAAAVA